jgi:SAM-dependent methyltransferase
MEALIDNRITDKNTAHSYIPVYEELFAPLRESCTALLEVGVFDGGSMKLWNDYFPKANLYGFDLSLARNQYTNPGPRVHLIEADAYQLGIVRMFERESFDIVIDDGWHTLDSMCKFAALYNRLVKPGGYLIIEDLQQVAWGDLIRMYLPDTMECKVLDRSAIKGRPDDILFIARKPMLKTEVQS